MRRLRYLSGLALLLLLGVGACSDSKLEGQLSEANKELAAAQAALDQLKTERPVLVHTVFFWLKEGVSEEEKEAFVEGCRLLSRFESIQAAFIGPPAPTADREVVDHSFDTALILHFASLDDQDAYQKAQVHLDFIDEYSHLWERVQVYDSSVE